MEVRTLLTPPEVAALRVRDLHDTVCVVFDVLRATSTLVAALANGARRVFPVLTVENARSLRRERLPDALLGGERGGVRIEGFDLGNSPREYLAAAVAGRDVITTTTNGTVALAACAHARTVLAAGLVNLDATAGWLLGNRSLPEKLLLVCAGTGNDFALEDGFAAGRWRRDWAWRRPITRTTRRGRCFLSTTATGRNSSTCCVVRKTGGGSWRSGWVTMWIGAPGSRCWTRSLCYVTTRWSQPGMCSLPIHRTPIRDLPPGPKME